MNLGDGFYISTAFGPPHLHVVVAIDGEWVVTFNVTTHPPRKDQSCPVDQNDDSRITKPSWIVFFPCEPMRGRYLDQEVQRGTLKVEQVSAAFLLKIQQGALQSTHTERKYKRLLDAMGITVPTSP